MARYDAGVEEEGGARRKPIGCLKLWGCRQGAPPAGADVWREASNACAIARALANEPAARDRWTTTGKNLDPVTKPSGCLRR